MNTPIGNRNHCNIFKVAFTSFYPSILFLNGITMEMQLHCSFVLSVSSHLISSILRFGGGGGGDILFNNVNNNLIMS